MKITPESTNFIVLSFEGPDNYSMAGGLGDRVTSLTKTLARMGFNVHHIFIGDPGVEAVEIREDGKLVLHRWCQWISTSHQGGVYDGEEWKFRDFTESAPLFVVQELVSQAISQGKLSVILAEEWQTAEAICCIHDLLHVYGWRDKTVMFWNANDTYSFERIDWEYLSRSATITTVSEHMKQIMLKMGINPIVIPNGIPEVLFKEVDKGDVSQMRAVLNAETVFSKVTKWRSDTGWKPAVQAIYNLKELGEKPKLLAHVGAESDRQSFARQVRSFGLAMKDISLAGNPEETYLRGMLEEDFTPYFEVISTGSKSDVLNLLFPLPYPFLRVLYQASDVVLANKSYDPFGLVGMEAMAAGAVIFVGRSAEGCATHMYNSVVLDHYHAEEIQFYVDHLRVHPKKREKLSKAARQTAERWTWKRVAETLISKLESQLERQMIGQPSAKIEAEPETEH